MWFSTAFIGLDIYVIPKEALEIMLKVKYDAMHQKARFDFQESQLIPKHVREEHFDEFLYAVEYSLSAHILYKFLNAFW